MCESRRAVDRRLRECRRADAGPGCVLAAIERHVPLALAAAPDTPTAMAFDLDPGEPATSNECVPVAPRLKAMLDGLRSKSVVKTSGGKGLHVLVPLNSPVVTFQQTKAFARAAATTLQRDDPNCVIASWITPMNMFRH